MKKLLSLLVFLLWMTPSVSWAQTPAETEKAQIEDARQSKMLESILEMGKEESDDSRYNNNVALIDTLESWSKTEPKYRPQLAMHYGNQSWFALFVEKFKEAENAGKRGLALDSSQSFIKTNIAHALLFQGKYDEAIKMYDAFVNDTSTNDINNNKATILKDLVELEMAAITHKDFQKIKEKYYTTVSIPGTPEGIDALPEVPLLSKKFYFYDKVNNRVRNTKDTLKSYRLNRLLIDSLEQWLYLDTAFQTHLTDAYLHQSAYSLVLKKFEEGENAARRGLKINSSLSVLKANLAHNLLFQGKYKAALKQYEDFVDGKPQSATTSNVDLIVQELDLLEKRGVWHSDTAKMKMTLQNR